MKYPRYKLVTDRGWWNTYLWVYDKQEQAYGYGKQYTLTWFIPHFIKRWLANRSRP